MDSLKIPKANSANSSASGSNSNLSVSASTSVVGSLATSPTSTVPSAAVAAAMKSPPGLSSSTPISVRFNANEESLDDILQSFHQNQHSHSPSGGGGGGDASPTLMGIKNNGSVGASLGMMVNTCESHSLSSSPSQHQMHQQHQQHQQQQHQHQQQQQHLQQQQAAVAASLFGNEEVNLRNNFLQGGGGSGGTGSGPGSGGFFNRKRSGSIEGVSPTSGGPNLITALSGSSAGSGESSGTATVGTWKLIKGKVTQTIEEIKSSKHHTTSVAVPNIVAETTTTTTTTTTTATVTTSSVAWSNEPDSETEGITINAPIGEEQAQQHNSDSDPEIELLDSSSLGSSDIGPTATISTERSRLRRGIAHIRSKVKAKQQAAAMNKKELGQATGTLRTNFLRRRNYAEANPEASTSGRAPDSHIRGSSSAPEIRIATVSKRGIQLARRDVEIESGVEVLEDMVPTADITNLEFTFQQSVNTVRFIDDKPITQPVQLDLPLNEETQSPLGAKPSTHSGFSLWSALSAVSDINWRISVPMQPLLVLLSLFAQLVLPLPEFLRGVLATILFIVTINYCSSYLAYIFENKLKVHPERNPFKVPNFENVPYCEIPPVLEHKTVKTYAGWLNETDCYDANTFSMAATRAIYVRLDGTALKISGTNARVPKRRMWNEKPIDRNKILFTDHRSYDLRDARIELLPVGLARKRFFNRKYPIQLIIKNSCNCSSSQCTDWEQDVHSRSKVPTPTQEGAKHLDFGTTIVMADLRQLHENITPDKELKDITIPCGDEVRLLLFARCDREKEDWYRRFRAASRGIVHESDLQVPMAHFVEDTDLQLIAAQQAINLTHPSINKTRLKESDELSITSAVNDETGSNTPDMFDDIPDEDANVDPPKDGFEGLIMGADVTRNPADYIKFMTVYQKACKQEKIPVYRAPREEAHSSKQHRKSRRSKRQEDELWRGIDQSLFLGPSGSVVWANVMIGRCLFSWLHDPALHLKIQDFMQKKLNSIKLPSFMEEVVITNINLGESPFLVHRVSQPMLDERGVWLDADITYEGLAHITVTTKLNLLRVRSKPKPSTCSVDVGSLGPSEGPPDSRIINDDQESNNAIFDSDAESSGSSSTDIESPPAGTTAENANPNAEFFQNSPGNARRIFKIVDRIATSNLFQYATELPYVQRAMENMTANITLRVDLKGLVARGTLNIPPPPSDRIWLCFRGPPRLWISTKPQVGDKSVDWSIVTNVIESKLCEAVNKFLVYPNMIDFTLPFLAKPSYGEEPMGQSS